jgi:hypothetical protein
MAASRLFLSEIEAATANRKDFAFEATLAGRSYLRLVRRLHKESWRTELIDLALPNMEMSKLRVAERVAHGGHNIPAADIERRFARRRYNLLAVFSGGRCLLLFHEQQRLARTGGRTARQCAQHRASATPRTLVKGGRALTHTSAPPSAQAQTMLRALQHAVAKNLEKKQKLGQYAVVWRNGRPVQTGPDAPKTPS